MYYNNTGKQRKPNLQREKERQKQRKERDRRQRRIDRVGYPRSNGVLGQRACI